MINMLNIHFGIFHVFLIFIILNMINMINMTNMIYIYHIKYQEMAFGNVGIINSSALKYNTYS